MKWIKASEKLWEYGKSVIVRYGDDVSIEKAHNITWCYPIEQIEWLDETEDAGEVSKVNRVEVIDEKGRSYVNWKPHNKVELQYQDEGRTLKVFINWGINQPPKQSNQQ